MKRLDGAEPQQETDQFQNVDTESVSIKNLSAILRGKAYELLDMARQLEGSLGAGAAQPPPPANKSHGDGGNGQNDQDENRRLDLERSYGELARRIYQTRRQRARTFRDETLFGEPAWDILLDLFAASYQNKRVAVTSACIGAAVPSSTALRWIKILEDKQLIYREHDSSDSRRSFVRLSEKGYAFMLKFFSEVRL